jgi:plastocyanin
METSPLTKPAVRLWLRLAGAALLGATGAIHLDLYLTGYRHIPTIGWLFLLQVIAAFALAAAVLVLRGPAIAAAGAGFAIATLGGYLLSLWVGLFGFQEVRTTAGIVAGVVEIAAFAVLGLLAAAGPFPGPDQGGLAGRLAALVTGRSADAARPAGAAMARGGRAVAGLAAVALVALGVSVATAGAGAAPSTAAGSGSPGRAALTIVIKNFKFTPSAPHVSPGERIEVKNEDPVPHSLTSGKVPTFNGLFNTGLLAPGQAKVIKAPDRAGLYPFFCMIHHFMLGMLVVGHTTASAAAALATFLAAQRYLPDAAAVCGRPRRARAPAALAAG